MAYNKLKFNDDKSEFLVVCAPWSRDEKNFGNFDSGNIPWWQVWARVPSHNLGVHIDHAIIMDVNAN